MQTNQTSAKPKTKTIKDWACQECDKLLTFKQAEKATMGIEGCPCCGSSDIFLASNEQMAKQRR